jgi:ribosomal protein S18 acetylase RimI-like enzyme
MAEEQQTDVQIRRAEPDDSAAIAAVLYESFAEYEPLYTPAAFAATTPASDQLLERMQEGPFWVALEGDRIVGTASVVSKSEGLYIRGMAVLPAARGRKTGWLLLEHMEDFAVQEGLKRLFLSTTPFLTQAIRLYERFGFRRIAAGPHDLLGTPLFTMEKTL